jgi:hypothetical protein
MWGSSNLKSKKQFIMKTKTFFKSALVVLLLGASMSATAYTRQPEICNGVTAKYDATARTFTLSNLPSALKEEPFCAWVTDPMWAEGTYDWSITTYSGTFTPGAKTYTTGRLKTTWGDPVKGGTNGSSYFSIALKHTNNDLPKGTPKAEDCSKAFKPQDFIGLCEGKSPAYCDNYNASFEGSIIYASGINNCSNDNMFMLADAGFTKWQTVGLSIYKDNFDYGTADVKDLVFYGTQEKVYPWGDGVMFFMNSDDKGGGKAGRGPNYCSSSFDPKATSVSAVVAQVSAIYPNPATVGQLVTVKGAFESDSKVYIYDATAKLIATVVPTITSEGLAFEVPAQASAINFVKITSANASYSAKLSVVK